MVFADPKSDIAFKKIFGNENRKEILISFLNAILDLDEGKKIIDIEILNPYQVPRIEGLKETTLDIRAKDQRDIHYIVEMQVQKKVDFDKRVLYYSAKAYAGQMEKTDDYPKLNQVIFIGICGFSIFQGKNFLTQHLILNTKTKIQELKDLEFNFIELTKFNKTEDELEDIIDQWIYFLKKAPDLKIIPINVVDKGLRSAYEVANTHKWTKREMEVFDYWLMREQDARGAIEYAKQEGIEKGIEKGIEEGIEKGIEKGKLQTAKNLAKLGISIDVICKATGLKKDQLKKHNKVLK